MHFCDLDFQDDVLEFDVFARTKDAKMLPYDQVRHAQQPHFPRSGSSNRVGARHTDKSMCCMRSFLVYCCHRSQAKGSHGCMQVPVLYVDEVPIAQTGSILRYLSRISGRDGEDPVRAAQADSAFEAAQEMPMAQIYVAVNLMEETEVRESAKAFQDCLPEYLINWSKVLGNQKFFHGMSDTEHTHHRQPWGHRQDHAAHDQTQLHMSR